MKEIKITSKGVLFVVLVDDEDYEWLALQAIKLFPGVGTNYAKISGDKGEQVHRLILKHHGFDLQGKQVDHHDRNGLNNQKHNLRICTRSQNKANVTKITSRVCSSRFKGVTKHIHGWYARIKVEQKYKCIAVLPSERDAALAYDIRARLYFGEFACLNIPDASEEDIERVRILIDQPRKRKNRTSSYFGVFRVRKNNKWGYCLLVNGHNFQKATFNSEIEAVKAYNDCAIKYLGEKAILNNI